MNQFTKSVRNSSGGIGSPQGARKSSWGLSFTLKISLGLAFVFGSITTRVLLADRTDKLSRQAATLKREIHECDLTIQNQKDRREQLCSMQYISRKIKEYRLGLRPTEPRQVKYLKRHIVPVTPEGRRESAIAMLHPDTGQEPGSFVSIY